VTADTIPLAVAVRALQKMFRVFAGRELSEEKAKALLSSETPTTSETA
jgi:hypothetical protein